jgi:hypothetical protein
MHAWHQHSRASELLLAERKSCYERQSCQCASETSESSKKAPGKRGACIQLALCCDSCEGIRDEWCGRRIVTGGDQSTTQLPVKAVRSSRSASGDGTCGHYAVIHACVWWSCSVSILLFFDKVFHASNVMNLFSFVHSSCDRLSSLPVVGLGEYVGHGSAMILIPNS